MKHLGLLVFVLFVGCNNATEAVDTRFELPNGLKVILKPIPESAHLALVTLFDIGGDHDPKDQSGLAHMVEHVYVTAATKNKKARNVQEYVAAYPLGWNAQTGDRYTVFSTLFQAKDLRGELQDAADRMKDLRVTEADLEREKPRIVSELYNMYGGIPQIAVKNLARERIRPSATGHRRGGIVDHVSRFNVDDVQTWWQKYYKPNNATLVLAGPFDVVEAKKQIEALYANIESGEELPKPLPAAKVDLSGIKAKKIKPIQRNGNMTPRVCLSYAAPAPDEEEFAAFLVLVAKLQTRKTELKTSPQDFPIQFMALDDPYIFYVTTEIKGKESASVAVKRLDAFVEKVANEEIKKGDRSLAVQNFAFFYNTVAIPNAALANNIYGAAFSTGRREQLGISGEELSKALLSVDQNAMGQCREQVFDTKKRAAVIVIPE